MQEYLENKELLLEFMQKIYAEEIPMFDEDGDDWTEEYEVFDEIEIYLADHPEVFEIKDIIQLLLLFDDKCFSEHLMDELANIVSNVAIYYKEEGIHEYCVNIFNIPEKGKFFGKYIVIRNLMHKAFSLFEKVLLDEETRVKANIVNVIETISVSNLIDKKEEILSKLK